MMSRLHHSVWIWILNRDIHLQLHFWKQRHQQTDNHFTTFCNSSIAWGPKWKLLVNAGVYKPDLLERVAACLCDRQFRGDPLTRPSKSTVGMLASTLWTLGSRIPIAQPPKNHTLVELAWQWRIPMTTWSIELFFFPLLQKVDFPLLC